jgi:hypothetical protein
MVGDNLGIVTVNGIGVPQGFQNFTTRVEFLQPRQNPAKANITLAREALAKDAKAQRREEKRIFLFFFFAPSRLCVFSERFASERYVNGYSD